MIKWDHQREYALKEDSSDMCLPIFIFRNWLQEETKYAVK